MLELIQGPDGEGRWLRVHDLEAKRETVRGAVIPAKDGMSDGRTTLQSITRLSPMPDSLPLCIDIQTERCFQVQNLAASVDEVLDGLS